jgi:hypothetical protein
LSQGVFFEALDLDGDGLEDLAGVEPTPNIETIVGLRLGSSFEAGTGSVIEEALVNTLTADVDGDGDGLDVVSSGAAAQILINDGTGALTVASDFLPFYFFGWRPVEVTDLDDDGMAGVLFVGLNKASVVTRIDATWRSVGGSVSGSEGFSRLDAFGPLTSEGDVSLRVRGSIPLTPTFLVLGFSPVNLPFDDGLLVPSLDVITTGLVTNALGEFALRAALPPGFEIWMQAFQLDVNGSYAATTAMRGVTR